MIEKLEQSSRGRTLISLAIVLLVLSQVVVHLPDSPLRRELLVDAQRLIRITGTDQSWGVFAPNPRRSSLGIHARIEFADGTFEVWELPDGPPIGANLRYYRWRKWLERVRADDYDELWEPTARWLADEYGEDGREVVEVQLVREFHENSLRGPQPEWRQFTFHTLEVGGEGEP